MTDTTHNTIVTVLLVLAGIIVLMLLGRWFQYGTLQPASAYYSGYNAYYPVQTGVTRYNYDYSGYPMMMGTNAPYYGQSSVTTYSRTPGSYYYTDTTDSTTYGSASDTSYEQTYSYTCDGMGHCWTNQ